MYQSDFKSIRTLLSVTLIETRCRFDHISQDWKDRRVNYLMHVIGKVSCKTST